MLLTSVNKQHTTSAFALYMAKNAGDILDYGGADKPALWIFLFQWGKAMTEIDYFSEAIHASLERFTESLEENASERYNEMRNSSFFSLFPEKQLRTLSEQSEIRKFPAGTNITTENIPSTSFFVIVYGAASAFVNNMHLGIIRSGECIGEGAFFVEGHLSSATVIANGEVVAIELKKHVVNLMSEDVKSYMDKALLHALFLKLQRTNKMLEIILRNKSKT